jgi:hypothetical protein
MRQVVVGKGRGSSSPFLWGAVLVLLASSCGRGASVPGLKRVRADVLQGTLYVSFVASALSWDAGVTIPIPGLAGVQLGVAPDLASSGTVFQLSAPLSALAPWAEARPALGLPDGRPLPDVLGGALPRWDFRVGRIVASAYLSRDAFGLFIPLEVFDAAGPGGGPLFSTVSMKVYDERGNRVGKVYALPAPVGGTGGGVLVLLPVVGGRKIIKLSK